MDKADEQLMALCPVSFVASYFTRADFIYRENEPQNEQL